MAKEEETKTEETQTEVTQTEESAEAKTVESSQTATGKPALKLDDSETGNTYSNFCYTAGTRSGILMGFGFHDWQPGSAIKVGTKVEISYYDAKRFLATLGQVIDKHEKAFGPLETDINKRVRK